MFSALSSYFTRVKRQFYKAVENARQPRKRSIEEVSDDEETFKRPTYTSVRKKMCPSRDEPFLPMTRTLHFTPTMRQEVHKPSSLASIKEDEPAGSRDGVSEIEIKKVTGLKEPATKQSPSVQWTSLRPPNPDAVPSTSSKTTQQKLKTYSRHRHEGANDREKLKIHRCLPVIRKSEAHPRKHLGVIKCRHPTSNTKPLDCSFNRWKSFTMEESFRLEEKKCYQQLLQQCTSNPSLSSSRSISQMSSNSSDSSSPPPSLIYEVELPNESPLSIHPETESENAVPVIRLSKSKGFKVPIIRKEKESSEDHKRYSDHYTAPRMKTPLSDITTSKRASNSRLRVAESVTRNWEVCEEEDVTLGQIIRHNHPQRRESNTIPVIDLSQSDSESVPSSRGSDSDSVEIVDEFPHGRRTPSTLKNLYDREWIKHMYQKCGRIAQEADIKDEGDTGLELERRKKISRRIHDKVEKRFQLLDIIHDSKGRSVQSTTEKPTFVPLTPEMQEEIEAALIPYPKSEALVHKFRIKITRRDMHTLDGLNWLNDEVINFYLSLIMERSKSNIRLPRIYAFTTFFYPKLYKSGHQSVSRWTTKVNIFAYDVLLVPIHLGVHWCMATVDFKEKCISYYDSMLGNNSQCLQLLLEYLELEHLEKKKTPYRTTAWKLQHMEDIPEQMNGSDCGVFSCQFAEYKSRRAQMDFDQGDMPYFRRRMVYEIIHAVLLE